MRKHFLISVVALTVVALLIAPGAAMAGARIQDEGRGTVSLNSRNDAPEQATGIAKFRLSESDGGWYGMKMELDVRNLPKRAGRVYEAWLIDDSESDKSGGSGIDDSVGAFQTDNDGDGGFNVSKRVVFFAPYSEIVVTSEQLNDTNPERNGPVVLGGSLD